MREKEQRDAKYGLNDDRVEDRDESMWWVGMVIIFIKKSLYTQRFYAQADKGKCPF